MTLNMEIWKVKQANKQLDVEPRRSIVRIIWHQFTDNSALGHRRFSDVSFEKPCLIFFEFLGDSHYCVTNPFNG